MTPKEKIEEIKNRLDEMPKYPFKHWPEFFIERPETNQMLNFGLSAHTDIQFLLKELEKRDAALELIKYELKLVKENADRIKLLLKPSQHYGDSKIPCKVGVSDEIEMVYPLTNEGRAYIRPDFINQSCDRALEKINDILGEER